MPLLPNCVSEIYGGRCRKIDAGIPEREFSSEPLDNKGSAPRRGRRSNMDEDLKRRTSEIFEEGLGHSGQPTARVKRVDGKCLRECSTRTCMASHLWHRIVLSSVPQASS